MSPKKQNSQISIKSIKRLIGYFRDFKIAIFFVAVASLASTASTIFAPKMLGEMVSAVSSNFEIVGGVPKFNPDFTEISKIGFALIAIYVFSGIFGYLQNWIMAGVSQKITFKMREQLSQKISKLPIQYFDQRKTGDIVSIIANDIETIGQSLSQSLSTVIYSAISIVGVSIMMISISWQMSLVAFGFAIVSVILISMITKFSQTYFAELQKTTGKINAHAEEMMSSHEIIKAYNGEEDSIEKFKKINAKMYRASWRSQFFGGITYPLMGVIGNLSSLSTAIFGGIRAINGQLSLGDLSSLLTYVGQFNRPITEVANSMTVIQATFAASERVFDFLDAKEENHNEKYAKLPKKIKGSVEFSKINFSYRKNKPVISNFSAKIPANSTVAIVGKTGAGKTTLVNLLMRFYDIDSGKIKIDGIDISKLHRKEVRSLFGMVLQDT